MTGGAALVLPIAVPFGVAAVAGGVWWGLRRWRGLRQERRRLDGDAPLPMVLETLLERWTSIAPRLGLVAKAKVTLSYLQVVLVMPEVQVQPS